jgi:hypothetical protein
VHSYDENPTQNFVKNYICLFFPVVICEEHSSLKSVSTCFKDGPWALLIIIPKHSLTGNLKHLNSSSSADGIILAVVQFSE